MPPYLVADIGGTNARFALVTEPSAGQFHFDHVRILSAGAYPSFDAALRTYFDDIGDLRPTAACIAIAGPVTGDAVRMTNLNWHFSCQEVAERFKLDHFLAINDFAAVAAACSKLDGEHLVCVKPGKGLEGATRAVFGPGTGLGVAGLINNRGRWLPNPSEGGHVNIAPATEFEADVIKAAMTELGHVSAESFISGPGLVRLYRAVCRVRGVRAEELKPFEITEEALASGDNLCFDALTTFCSFAGSFAGNLALTYGAQDGIYIAGGILPRFSDFLINSPFGRRFCDKGIMSHYLQDIPVNLIVHPETAFVGAAAALEQHLHHR